MSETFTAREFSKYGFQREAEKDFRDDGTTFKIYSYKGMEVSYCKDGITYFINVRPHLSRYGLTWLDIKDEDWFKLLDEFNGCKVVDMDKLVQNINFIDEKLTQLGEAAKRQVLDYKVLDNQLQKEIEECKYWMEYYKVNFDWFNASAYVINRSKSYYTKAAEYIEEASKITYKGHSQYELRCDWMKMEHYGYINSNLYSYSKALKDYANGERTY